MTLLIDRILDGLGNGAICSLMALAVVLIFMSTGTINFAQGAMGMFSAFLVWQLASESGWPLIPAVALSIVCGGAAGAAFERLLIRPLESETGHLPVIIVTLGLLLVITAAAGSLFTTHTVSLPSVFPKGTVQLGDVSVKNATIGLIGTAALVSLGMWVLFMRTRLGLAIRAAVDNPDSAQLAGINRSRMHMLGWALAGGLGALTAALIAPSTLVNTHMMDNVLFLGFAAAAIGGFSSPPGAVVGGFVIGLVESLGPAYLPGLSSQYSMTLIFGAMLAVLLIRPTGIFGRKESTRL